MEIKQQQKTILVLGDSLSKGVSFSEEKKRYFFLKDSFVNNLSKATGANIVNVSKFGSTVVQGKAKLKQRLERYSPEIVLLEFGGNDCDFAWDEIATNPYAEHTPKTPLNEYEMHLIEMVEMIKQYGATPVVMTLPPLNAVNYFKWFTKGSKEKADNILKWLEDVSKIYWWHERYSSVVASVAEQCDVPLADARRYFLKTPDFRKYVCLDGIHPNKSGHQLITTSILYCFNRNSKQLKLFNA